MKSVLFELPPKENWQLADSCSQCNQPFTIFRRRLHIELIISISLIIRHHCRKCGTCQTKRIAVPKFKVSFRVCDFCHDELSCEKSENPSSLKTQETIDWPKSSNKSPCLTSLLVQIETLLYAVGGVGEGTPLKSMEFYNPMSNIWKIGASITSFREGAGIVVYNKILYIIGGREGKRVHDSVEYYDPVKKEWFTLETKLLSKRAYFACALNQSTVYVAGGIDDDDTVESYDLSSVSSVWKPVKSMQEKRSGCVGATLFGYFFIIGGQSNAHSFFLNSVECYNINTDSWKACIPSMLTKRSRHCATVSDNKIYVCGGTDDGQNALDSCEYFDFASNSWIPISPMLFPRVGCAVVALPFSIAVIGGSHSVGTSSNQVEFYDFDDKEWDQASTMCEPRYGLCAALID